MGACLCLGGIKITFDVCIIYKCIYVRMCVCMYVRMYVCMYVCMYAYICVYLSMYKFSVARINMYAAYKCACGVLTYMYACVYAVCFFV